jgi:hypothetical protein
MRKGSTRIGATLASLALAALLVAASPGLAAFKSGTYTGKTSQDDLAGDPYPLMMEVKRSKKKLQIAFFEYNAPPCGQGEFGVGGTARIKRSGKFKYVDEFGYGYIKGKFKGRRASGTLRYHAPATTCDTGVLDWTAKKSS